MSNYSNELVKKEEATANRYNGLWVVVPFYLGHCFISSLLDGLSSCLTEGLNVVFVDNSPVSGTDCGNETWRVFMEAYRSLNVLRASPAIGFGRACNLGSWFASKHGASHILLLNQDAMLSASALERLWRTACATPSALVAPVEVIPNTTLIHPQYAEWYLNGLLPQDTLYNADELPQSPQLRKTLGGMCMVVPCEVIREVGLFDPLFTMYGEDGDFCRRARAAGIVMYLEPRARLEHEHSNLSASGHKRAQVVTWIRESRAIVILRDTDSSLVSDILKVGGRRVLERIYDAFVLRDLDRLRLAVESDRRLVRRASSLARARRGETPLQRMEILVGRDWSNTSVV